MRVRDLEILFNVLEMLIKNIGLDKRSLLYYLTNSFVPGPKSTLHHPQLVNRFFHWFSERGCGVY